MKKQKGHADFGFMLWLFGLSGVAGAGFVVLGAWLLRFALRGLL